MVARPLLYSLAALFLLACKGTEGPTGPAGPSERVASANAYNPVSTTSTAVQPIPQMSVTANLTSPATVVVNFSAETYLSQAPTSGGNGLVVNMQVDGSNLVPAVSFTASPYYGANSFTWTTSLSTGQHIITANWNLCGTGCSGLTGYAAARQLTATWVN